MKQALTFSLVVFLFTLTSANPFANATPKADEFSVDASVLRNADQPFIQHTKNKPFGSYLSMNVRFEPVHSVYKAVETYIGKKLKNRGEAHVTTVTPPEYDHILKGKVSIQEINEIALKNNIQKSDLKIECIGRGKKGNKETYFIVVTSQGLLKIRKEIEDLYRSRGGSKIGFVHDEFYPHITLGFTHRDLHMSDGIVKDQRSCWSGLALKESK